MILRFRSAGMRFRRIPRVLGAFRVTEQQKTRQLIETVGRMEMNRLRIRELGRVPTDREVRKRIKPYMRRHWIADKLFALHLAIEQRRAA